MCPLAQGLEYYDMHALTVTTDVLSVDKRIFEKIVINVWIFFKRFVNFVSANVAVLANSKLQLNTFPNSYNKISIAERGEC